MSVGRVLGKTQNPRWIDKTLDKSLYRGDNLHLISRFCDDELGPKFQHGIRACRIRGPPTYSRTKPKECWAWGGVLEKTQVRHLIDKTLDKSLYRGDNLHLTRRFCGVVLGLTTISKMVSEPLQDPLGHLLSGFRYRATHHLCPRTKPNSVGREGCIKSPTSDRWCMDEPDEEISLTLLWSCLCLIYVASWIYVVVIVLVQLCYCWCRIYGLMESFLIFYVLKAFGFFNPKTANTRLGLKNSDGEKLKIRRELEKDGVKRISPLLNIPHVMSH